MIYKLKLKHKEKLNIKWMCEMSGVSRSGYYNYVKNLTSSKYLLKEEKDKEDFDLIIKRAKIEAHPLYPVPKLFDDQNFQNVLKKALKRYGVKVKVNAFGGEGLIKILSENKE